MNIIRSSSVNEKLPPGKPPLELSSYTLGSIWILGRPIKVEEESKKSANAHLKTMCPNLPY